MDLTEVASVATIIGVVVSIVSLIITCCISNNVKK